MGTTSSWKNVNDRDDNDINATDRDGAVTSDAVNGEQINTLQNIYSNDRKVTSSTQKGGRTKFDRTKYKSYVSKPKKVSDRVGDIIKSFETTVRIEPKVIERSVSLNEGTTTTTNTSSNKKKKRHTVYTEVALRYNKPVSGIGEERAADAKSETVVDQSPCVSKRLSVPNIKLNENAADEENEAAIKKKVAPPVPAKRSFIKKDAASEDTKGDDSALAVDVAEKCEKSSPPEEVAETEENANEPVDEPHVGVASCSTDEDQLDSCNKTEKEVEEIVERFRQPNLLLPKAVVQELKQRLIADEKSKKKVKFHPDVVDRPRRRRGRKPKPDSPIVLNPNDSSPDFLLQDLIEEEDEEVEGRDNPFINLSKEFEPNEVERYARKIGSSDGYEDQNRAKDSVEDDRSKDQLDENANVASIFVEKFKNNRQRFTAIEGEETPTAPRRTLSQIPEEGIEIELKYDRIVFSEPEPRHIIERASSSDDSELEIVEQLDSFIMDPNTTSATADGVGGTTIKKKKSGFKKIMGVFSSNKKDKNKDKREVDKVKCKEEKKLGKKTENQIFSDNARNETNFNRNVTYRHTFSGSNNNHQQQQQQKQYQPQQKYANRFPEDDVQTDGTLASNNLDHRSNGTTNNYTNVKYIDTSSSSSNTLSSDNDHEQKALRNCWNNLQRQPSTIVANRPNLQLISPKATIPINSERALPNPYQNRTIDRNLNVNDKKDYVRKSNDSILDNNAQADEESEDPYGTVYDIKSVPAKLVVSSPKPQNFERSKLKLPPNRDETVDVRQPRIKSPIPETKVSTDKIIATELLKNKTKNEPSITSKTSDDSGSMRSIKQHLEAAEWQKKQNELSKAPSLVYPIDNNNYNNQQPPQQTFTEAIVHVPSPTARQQFPRRASTPVSVLSTTSSLQASPKMEEVRQRVEEYVWCELKKMREAEDNRFLIDYSKYGYAEEPRAFKRNSMPNINRTLSLPREIRREPRVAQRPTPLPANVAYQQQQFVRSSPSRRTIDAAGLRSNEVVRPIFNRGSLRPADYQLQAQSLNNKKVVSFNGSQPSWPTRNGYVQSPPQRHLMPEQAQQQRHCSHDSDFYDDVFLLPEQEPFPRTMPTNRSTLPSYVGVPSVDHLTVTRPPLPPGQRSRGVYNGENRQAGSVVNENRVPNDILVRSNQQRFVPEPTYGNTRVDHFNRRTFTDGVNESPYASRQDFQAQPTIAYRTGAIYDNEPIYGQRRPSTNRPYDVYNNHLQTGAAMMRTLPPPSLQSPQGSFQRGGRLTSSANDMYKRLDQQRYGSQEMVYGNQMAPNRPLPPVPQHQQQQHESKTKFLLTRRASQRNERQQQEQQSMIPGDYGAQRATMTMDRHLQARNFNEEEWNSDGKSGRGGLSGNESGSGRNDSEGELRGRSGRNARRDDPRRHTLASGDQQYNMSGQGGPLSRTMDLEMSSTSRSRKAQPRGYPPPSNAMLFDDDPGIMSEVETSSTGFRRGGKQRSSLPVVRTPSKTLERPLGLVFLQYRNETKRALLPNEITSIDTVKALFVRSFPKQLSMEYLDSPQVKIYIHDSSKDVFYELEDVRSHLREIRDRSVLRLFESADVSGGLPMAGIGIAGGVGHFEDPSYFSEPEFDSEYQHQHIHKSKGSAGKGAPYYMGSTASLPRGAALMRAYSPAVAALPPDRLKSLPTGAPPKPQRAYAHAPASGGVHRRSSAIPPRPPERFVSLQRSANSLFHIPDGYMSSPERGSRGYEDPYYTQYGTRSGSITPVIDEEISDTELMEESYSLYGVKLPSSGPRPAPRSQFPPPASVPPYDATRLRVENMERQLANLTGLVQKALTQAPSVTATASHLQVPSGREGYRSDKSVSFEKSVSFSDEPPDMNSPKQHSPQHAERDRLKPAPPPKPASLSPGQYDGRHIYRDLQLTPEMYNQLRGLQKKAKDLRAEVRNLRRMSQAQAHSVRETIRDTFIKIRAMLLAGGEQVWQAGMDQERMRLSREEDLYKQEMLRLEKDLSDLESTVEELRGNVINRKTRVNMSDVENMALVLSKSSKTVADLKLRFPSLQDGMKAFLGSEMEKVVREEKFLKEEPERLESALRRCKKLTGTLVTLKRLASVQEQRLPCSTAQSDGRLSPTLTETPPVTPTSAQHSKPVAGARVGQIVVGGDCGNAADGGQRPENALDALLDELQTFSKPHPHPSATSSSSSSTVNTQLPQVSSYTADPTETPPSLPVKGIIPPAHHLHHHHHHMQHAPLMPQHPSLSLSAAAHAPTMSEIGRKGSMDSATFLPTQNLTVSTATGSLRRLHSYPSGSDTDNSPPIQPMQQQRNLTKPPIPERNVELLQHVTATGKRVPPPPPPRTSSKSPLASPTSPGLPPRSPAAGLQHIQNVQHIVENSGNKPQSQFEAATQNLGLGTLRRNAVARTGSVKDRAQTLPRNIGSNLQVQHVDVESLTNATISASNSSSCESVNSQDGSTKSKSTRKEELEQRHQELLKKQKALQEQYARLQQLQRGNNTLAVVPPAPDQLLKKTGSESNLLQKMGLQMTAAQMTGSLTHLPNSANKIVNSSSTTTSDDSSSVAAGSTLTTASSSSTETTSSASTTNSATTTSAASTTTSTTTNKVYETDIL